MNQSAVAAVEAKDFLVAKLKPLAVSKNVQSLTRHVETPTAQFVGHRYFNASPFISTCMMLSAMIISHTESHAGRSGG